MLSATEALPVFQTVEEFERWERAHSMDGNCEFVRGRLIQKESVHQTEAHLYAFLLRRFSETAAYQRGGVLMAKSDVYVDAFTRRIPNLTYFSTEQLQAIREGKRVGTAFAIELMTSTETHYDFLERLQDYFDGGAQLVWYIAPPMDTAKRQKIYVYTSPDESKAFKGSEVITAAPVVPDFQFRVEELFA